jgi:hypothetical protein
MCLWRMCCCVATPVCLPLTVEAPQSARSRSARSRSARSWSVRPRSASGSLHDLVVGSGAACVAALVDRFNQHCRKPVITADSWRARGGSLVDRQITTETRCRLQTLTLHSLPMVSSPRA